MKKVAGKASFKQPGKKGVAMPKAAKAGDVGPKLAKFKSPKNVAPPKKMKSIEQVTAFRKAKYGV